LHITGRLADAMTIDGSRLMKESYSEAKSPRSDLACSSASLSRRPSPFIMQFGNRPKRKVLCSCGVISEVDQGVAIKKLSLGKALECRTCRNERIARERDELERHFTGQGDEGEE
jgi:hypothetical protein